MIVRRSLTLLGHRTSLALEPEFWQAVERLAEADGLTLPGFIAEIDRTRGRLNLASAVRVAVLNRLTRGASSGQKPDNGPVSESDRG